MSQFIKKKKSRQQKMSLGFTFSLHPEGGSGGSPGTKGFVAESALHSCRSPERLVKPCWWAHPQGSHAMGSEALASVSAALAQQDRDVDSGLMGAGSREKALEGTLGWMGLTSQDWTGTPHLS